MNAIETILRISYLLNLFISVALGLLLLMIKTLPQLEELMYHRAKVFLAVATIITGLGNGALLLFGTGSEYVDYFSLISMVVSALQACLFTFLVLTLFNSEYVRLRNVLVHLSPTFVLVFVYLLITSIQPDVKVYSFAQLLDNKTNPGLIVRIVYALVYIVQLFTYTSLFLRERRIYVEKIQDYFSDMSNLKLRIGTNLFFQALTIGVAVIAICFYPGAVQDTILTFLITVFYFYFVVTYINYQYTLQQVIPAVEEVSVCDSPAGNNNLQLKDRLESLMAREFLYLRSGVVIEDLADRLDIHKRALSSFIHTTYGMHFNNWISHLRVEYAKKMIESKPELSLQEVAECSGFADNPMMSRQFKKFTGCSPSEFRKTKK